ncbi:hypothetical protein [Streptomyces poonensis]|uniref:Uncharacterized protein n=1 Tax=Streptomyces poonensis TaxID=68255 RepID=A0A918P839_9ACTN|nr:hypothetical protein [Streptomyces poonensis]GGY90718.1 hypothetical protein GCM10010365_06400 [Streptomyces poonensis]GLJ87923.1 hypothetical protein GCM10017589_05230 [Streptomyces poonensis]
MLDLIVRLLACVLSLCMPSPRGRHRAVPPPVLTITPTPTPVLAPPPCRFTERLDGGASRLIRPYLLTPEEHRRQRERRRALRLAGAIR